MKLIEASKISFVIPAKNEAAGLSMLLPKLTKAYPASEIIVVNDGSSDNTVRVVADCGATVVSHPYSKGNGAAIKTGARCAKGDYLVFMDADGQHRIEDIRELLLSMDDGFDMVVGARNSLKSQAGLHRAAANGFYNKFASWMTGHKVLDLTSGLRVVSAKKFREYLWLLPNGFSYPTTITMAFFRSGYSINYVPIVVEKRVGKSHIKLLKDGVRFLLIIFKVGTLYSPLKIFFPVSVFFIVSGLFVYLDNYLSSSRFTNMSALLLSVGVLVFLIGLVSEQVTALLFKGGDSGV